MIRDRTAAALIAEAFGTFLFFFVGAGSVVLGDYLAATGGSGPGLLGVALAHGLALAVLVSALGAVSGGHFNPAVTLGVWIMGRITPARAALYVVAQLVGGLAAGLALKVVFADSWQASNIGTPALGSRHHAGPRDRHRGGAHRAAGAGRDRDGGRPAWAEDRRPGHRAGGGGGHPGRRPADRRGDEPVRAGSAPPSRRAPTPTGTCGGSGRPSVPPQPR